MNKKIKSAQELKALYNTILKDITIIENSTPRSSDELYEQTKLLTQYHRTLIELERELDEAYLSLGVNHLYNELQTALTHYPKDFISKQIENFHTKR
ncbi:hypothetical protein [Sulfurimonas sp.]